MRLFHVIFLPCSPICAYSMSYFYPVALYSPITIPHATTCLLPPISAYFVPAFAPVFAKFSLRGPLLSHPPTLAPLRFACSEKLSSPPRPRHCSGQAMAPATRPTPRYPLFLGPRPPQTLVFLLPFRLRS